MRITASETNDLACACHTTQAPPPMHDALRLKVEVMVVSRADREDALQEAWLAYLSGRSPHRAVNTFAKRERRRRRREVASAFLS